MPTETIITDLPSLHTDKRLQTFIADYIACRTQEKRMYTDEELVNLPACERTHPHYHEWRIRSQTTASLLQYLSKKNKPLTILEIGCGNGWLSNRLSEIKNAKVTGIDINLVEIEQAARVFAGKKNLHFVYGELASKPFNDLHFDAIVFAASIQYFPLATMIHQCMQQLHEDGEIHIIDSPFYMADKQPAAKIRSRNYYRSIGFPSLSDFYFHHCLSDLNLFNAEILPGRKTFFQKLAGNISPFPWIRITKNKG